MDAYAVHRDCRNIGLMPIAYMMDIVIEDGISAGLQCFQVSALQEDTGPTDILNMVAVKMDIGTVNNNTAGTKVKDITMLYGNIVDTIALIGKAVPNVSREYLGICILLGILNVYLILGRLIIKSMVRRDASVIHEIQEAGNLVACTGPQYRVTTPAFHGNVAYRNMVRAVKVKYRLCQCGNTYGIIPC